MRVIIASVLTLAACLTGSVASQAADDNTVHVYRGARIITISHGEIPDGDLVIRGGKIIAVGKRGELHSRRSGLCDSRSRGSRGRLTSDTRTQ